MRPLRAAMLTLAVYAGLMWVYCILRIFTGDIPFNDPVFVDAPYIATFLSWAIGSFVVSMCCFFMYWCLE